MPQSHILRPFLLRRASAWRCTLGFLVAAPAGGFCGATEPVRVEIKASDIDGHAHAAAEPGARATVWVFVAHDCPICNGYTPLLARLTTEYASREVRWNIVYAEPELTAAAIRDHAKTYALKVPLLADSDLKIARRFGVTTTPEVAVVDADSQLAYRGRIDDLYAEPGRRRAQAQTHDLRDAIEAVLAGRPVPLSRTVAVGCTLELPGATAPTRSLQP